MHSAISTSVFLFNDIAEGSDGGGISAPSTNTDGRLTGARPLAPQNMFPRLLCSECGCEDIQATAWIHANTGEVLNDDGPTDQLWCPECEEDCSSIEDCGLGFELWREGEWSGIHPTFAAALAEAKQSDRPFEIATNHCPKAAAEMNDRTLDAPKTESV